MAPTTPAVPTWYKRWRDRFILTCVLMLSTGIWLSDVCGARPLDMWAWGERRGQPQSDAGTRLLPRSTHTTGTLSCGYARPTRQITETHLVEGRWPTALLRLHDITSEVDGAGRCRQEAGLDGWVANLVLLSHVPCRLCLLLWRGGRDRCRSRGEATARSVVERTRSHHWLRVREAHRHHCGCRR